MGSDAPRRRWYRRDKKWLETRGQIATNGPGARHSVAAGAARHASRAGLVASPVAARVASRKAGEG